jgi:hypothetical protein
VLDAGRYATQGDKKRASVVALAISSTEPGSAVSGAPGLSAAIEPAAANAVPTQSAAIEPKIIFFTAKLHDLSAQWLRDPARV